PGSADSFLLDPLLLFLDGLVRSLIWERHWKTKGYSRALPLAVAGALLGVFYSISISLWLDLTWVDGFARLCGAKTGRDWMLNSGVFHFDYTQPPSLALNAFA